MAKLVYGLSQSLDGYVDHMKLGPPAPAAFRHFLELVRGLTGLIYGRRTYEIMRYWDEDLPDWDAEDRDFAVAWRSQPKWVVSRSLKSAGPNATLVADDFDRDVLWAYDHCDGASKACLGRYCLLFRYGGIYSDPGLMFVAPVLRSVDSKLHAFRSADANAYDVSVSLIAAPADLPLFEKCIRKFVRLTRNHDGDLGSAGPRLFGETIAFCDSVIASRHRTK